VFKAVDLDGRELKCACVGGGSRVPLGFVSLTENLVMMLMGLWMPLHVPAAGLDSPPGSAGISFHRCVHRRTWYDRMNLSNPRRRPPK
jgi:hypothetical protein